MTLELIAKLLLSLFAGSVFAHSYQEQEQHACDHLGQGLRLLQEALSARPNWRDYVLDP